MTTKINKTIGLLRKLQNLLPGTALITICKAFLRSHLDYGDIFYDRAFNLFFHQKLESIQYRSCLAISGAIRGTCRERIYQELSLESLQSPRWYRKLAMFYKIYKNKSPFNFLKVIPALTSSHLQSLNGTSWISPFGIFKITILNFIRSTARSFFNRNNHKGIRLMTRLHLGLSHQNCNNPLCSCSMNIESTSHFFLHYPLFDDKRIALPSTLGKLDSKLIDINESYLTETLLFGN